MTEVVPVAAARADLTRTLQRFRRDPHGARPVVLGAHRVPEAVLVPYAQYREQHAAGTRDTIRRTLHERRDMIERLARASRLSDVHVFGSVVRGEESSDSDIDLLVTPGPEASLFDLAQFELDVEALMGRPVDVVSARTLDPVRDAGILAEAEPL